MKSADLIQVKEERQAHPIFARRSKLIAADSWPTETIAKDEVVETKEWIKQETVQELHCNAENVGLDALDMEENDMSDEQLNLKLGHPLLKAAAASSSGDADAGAEADVQSCGAPADSSFAAQDADEDTVIPESKRLKTHRSNLQNTKPTCSLGLSQASAPKPSEREDPNESDDAAGLPMPAHPMPTPTAAPARKTSEGFMKCTSSQNDDECMWCAYPRSTGCPDNFPFRGEEEQIRCRNKIPAFYPFCISHRCGLHCEKPDCLRHRPRDEGTERRQRIEGPRVTNRHRCLAMA